MSSNSCRVVCNSIASANRTLTVLHGQGWLPRGMELEWPYFLSRRNEHISKWTLAPLLDSTSAR